MRKLCIICLAFFLSAFGCSCGGDTGSIADLTGLGGIEDVLESEQVTLTKAALNNLSVTYKIRYLSDGCEVVGYIAAPVNYLEKTYPVMIYNRGGNRDFGMLNPDLIAYYATRGYVVLASQYRGVDGGTGTEQFGGDDLNDVLKLTDIAEKFEFVRSGGVYMVGSSRGGMMTYMACRVDPRIRAAAVLSGITDAAANYNDREQGMKDVYTELVGGTPDELPAEYEKRSAVLWADEIDVPILIIHGGEADWRVDCEQSKKLAAELEKHGKEHKLVIYEEADHSLTGTDYLNEIDSWFAAHPIG